MTIESNYSIAIALRSAIGLKISRQFFNQWKAKANTNCTLFARFFPRLEQVRVIAKTSDWFIAQSSLVVIGGSNNFGIGFLTVIWKPLYMTFIYIVCPKEWLLFVGDHLHGNKLILCFCFQVTVSKNCFSSRLVICNHITSFIPP